MVKPLLAAACCMVVVACAAGGAKKSMAPAPAETAGAPSTMPGDPRAEIERLDAEITASSAKLELPQPTPAQIEGTQAQPMGVMPSSQDPTCKPAKTETCTTSCTLSDSICGNADKICTLAKDLGDDWSAKKCAKANTTCESSRTKCCGCQ